MKTALLVTFFIGTVLLATTYSLPTKESYTSAFRTLVVDNCAYSIKQRYGTKNYEKLWNGCYRCIDSKMPKESENMVNLMLKGCVRKVKTSK